MSFDCSYPCALWFFRVDTAVLEPEVAIMQCYSDMGWQSCLFLWSLVGGTWECDAYGLKYIVHPGSHHA